MIAFDTNVLVRYVMQDDEQQAQAATRLIESRCSNEDPGLISSIVLCELTWVLGRGYRADRQQIATVLRNILTAGELQVDEPDLAWRALRLFEANDADFADYLIGAGNRERGASVTYTFDRAAAKCDLFAPVSPDPTAGAPSAPLV